MSTAGQKRKLEDTDIPVDDNEAPPIKQPKLMDADTTQKSPEPTPNAASTNDTKTVQTTFKAEQKETETPNNNNNNDELEQETMIGTIQKVQAQLEYYFGDSNLPLDHHILETAKMPRNAGYYPLSGLLTFTMIKSLTDSVNTLRKSIESSAKLQLNANGDGVRRHPSMGAPPTKQDIFQRSIFAKGFHPRTELSELTAFWKQHVAAQQNILSVRTIKDKFSVGIGADNREKMVKRFIGSCVVEFVSCELAAEFAKMTFQHNGRAILCGLYGSYFYDETEWKIKKKYHPFEADTVVFIRDIPVYATYSDVKNWICNGLYAAVKKKDSANKVGYVYKAMNAGCAYARFEGESDVKECVMLIRKKPLMGLYPKVIALGDEQARKVWKKVGEMQCCANKDVEIVIKKKGNSNDNKNRRNQDQDIDMEGDSKQKGVFI